MEVRDLILQIAVQCVQRVTFIAENPDLLGQGVHLVTQLAGFVDHLLP